METTESVTGSTGPSARRKPTALEENTPDDLRRAAEEVASSVEQLYRTGDAFLGKHAQERPYAVLGAAAGIGFVLGGGLAWRLAGTLVNVAGRMAVTHAVNEWLGVQGERP